jgi:hypothetical protein
VIPERSFSYPIFGTKRYHRANNAINQVPNYQPQYYDNSGPYNNPAPQPQYYPAAAASQYSARGAPKYIDDSNLNSYQKQQQQYSLYGMPTYRGEYKPTTYYYAPGPSYTYSDDRVEPANPLDDIHEEIMQEDQMERTRDMIPYGQETWFEKSNRPASLVNTNAAFLRNLIEYNNQMNYARDEPDNEYVSSDYGDYEQNDLYDQPGAPQSAYNNYNGQQPTMYNHNANTNHNNHEPVAKFIDERNEDEDVKELKKLSQKNHGDYYQPPANDWQQDTASYDMEPSEYDDDQWITWDKRNKADNPETKGEIVSSIFTFNNRKPTVLVKPTKKPTINNKKPSIFSGQKEVAQPVRHPLSATIVKIEEEASNVEPQPSNVPSGAIYDTIKKILDMEQNLEKVSV